MVKINTKLRLNAMYSWYVMLRYALYANSNQHIWRITCRGVLFADSVAKPTISLKKTVAELYIVD